jgi:hypothetical protein
MNMFELKRGREAAMSLVSGSKAEQKISKFKIQMGDTGKRFHGKRR